MTKVMKGKHFFSSVKVGDRGQIVIPIDARKMFDINPGDQLLIFGVENKGLAIAKASLLKDFIAKLFEVFGSDLEGESEEKTD
jgi:AbrB family looped-hinge helix DNA binding protein